MPNLAVHQLVQQDVYRDIIRVNEDHRFDGSGSPIFEGKVCRVRVVGGAKCYAILRGYQASNAAEIRMDDVTRGKLNLKFGETKDFEFQICGPWGQMRWAWNATEIGYQISSRLALIGLVLGLIGLALGLPDWVKKICATP